MAQPMTVFPAPVGQRHRARHSSRLRPLPVGSRGVFRRSRAGPPSVRSCGLLRRCLVRSVERSRHRSTARHPAARSDGPRDRAPVPCRAAAMRHALDSVAGAVAPTAPARDPRDGAGDLRRLRRGSFRTPLQLSELDERCVQTAPPFLLAVQSIPERFRVVVDGVRDALEPSALVLALARLLEL